MPRNNRRPKKKLPQIKKEIKDFLLSEEGKISKKNIAKLGISLAILAMAFQPQSVQAGHSSTHSSHSSHSNTLFSSGRGGHSSDTSPVSVHASAHANHGNHSSGGGWC